MDRLQIGTAIIIRGPEKISKTCIALIGVLQEASYMMEKAQQALVREDYAELQEIIDCFTLALPNHVMSVMKRQSEPATAEDVAEAQGQTMPMPTNRTVH